MKEQAVSLYPRLKDKFYKIYNSLDFDDIYKKALEEPKDLPKTKYILALQRLKEDKKDARCLIEAFSIISKNPLAKAFSLYIIGDGEDRESLQELINKLGLEKRITLMGYRANPYPYLAKSDIFVLSSKSEGFNISLIEAMILGRNLISTNCKTGTSEALDYGRAGRLVAVSDSKAMAEAIIDCISNEEENQRLREHAKSYVLNFEIDGVLKEIYKLVEETIELYKTETNAKDK